MGVLRSGSGLRLLPSGSPQFRAQIAANDGGYCAAEEERSEGADLSRSHPLPCHWGEFIPDETEKCYNNKGKAKPNSAQSGPMEGVAKLLFTPMLTLLGICIKVAIGKRFGFLLR
jgi:hypothetical protein